jgi:hypothetical protein
MYQITPNLLLKKKVIFLIINQLKHNILRDL